MNIFLTTVLFVILVQTVYCANILGVFLFAGVSHYSMFETILKKLAELGHNVDVVTHFPSRDIPKGYNQLNIMGSRPNFRNNLSVDYFHTNQNFLMGPIFGELFAGQCELDTCENTLKHPVLHNLKNSDKKYDLLITELFGTDCPLGFAHLFKIPTVQLVSSVNLPWANDRYGNPDNPSYIPNYFVTYEAKMSFIERIHNTVSLIQSKLIYRYFTIRETEIARKFFGDDLPNLEEIAQDASLLLVNSHFSMNEARPLVPNVIEVGGLHIEESKPLSPYFKELLSLDKNTKGVIYLTMGSMVLTETFTTEKLQALFDAFSELPYKVLWKGVQENFSKRVKIPKNIHFEDWMPQKDILCHPNVKLFVSHGGLLGSQEAIHCGVPRLGIPLFADQETNIRSAERKGLAIRVGYNEITKEKILNATVKLLTDPKYQDNLKKVSSQFRDRPMSPLDTAVYWVEYVIKHKGAPHLRTAGADLPWYQYHLLDVISILIGVSIIGLCLIVFVVKATFIKLKQGKNKKKSD